MKIVLAPDSFKESMTAVEAAQAMARGVQRVYPHARLELIPMADGGEGTTATLAHALGAELIQVEVQDALARPRMAHLAWNAKTRLTILEVAEACGLEHIEEQERNPKAATSFGVGTKWHESGQKALRRVWEPD